MEIKLIEGPHGSYTIKSVTKKHSLRPSSNYRCHEGQCRKVFGKLSNMINHLRVHTGERPFACFDCKVSFKQKGQMVKHNMTQRHRERASR
jgi:KRAB domain-containing zinc finger protein